MKKQHRKFLKQHRKSIALILATVIVLAAATSVYAARQLADSASSRHLVTFYDRGTKQSIVTRAETVKEALRVADITVNPQDIVEPSLRSKLTTTDVDVIIYRSRPVTVVDGSLRQTVLTVAQSPNEIVKAAKRPSLSAKDKASFGQGTILTDGAAVVLTVERAEESTKKAQPKKVAFGPTPQALTASRGAQVFVDSDGVAHRETYYDLPMNIVINTCGGGTYSVRSDGAKIDQDGYVLIAANLSSYPRCSVVETSLGPGKVYDTGGFAVRHPYGFDLATDWTNYDGR